jgi:hypothetical protein
MKLKKQRKKKIKIKDPITDVENFKNIADGPEKIKRLNYYVKEYGLHIDKLKDVKPLDADATEEDKKELTIFVKNHMVQAGILRDYIKAFLPSTSDKNKLSYNKGKVYYDGQKL